MKKHYSLVAIVVLLLFSVSGFSTNYYAAPNATGSGTFADPCNLSTGITKLANGSNDTLFVRGGIYELSSQISINRNGTSNCRLAIFAYKDEKPVLDFRRQLYGNGSGLDNTYNRPGISLNQASTYIHIKGLTICYASDNGMINNGSYHIIENCVFHDNCDSGLQHKNGCGNLILNCDAYNNFDYQTGGIGRADFGGNADGFADKQYNNNDEPNIYDGCRAWGNADDGWDFFEKIGSTIIRNSFCYKNGPATYDMTNHPRYNTDKAWFDQFPRTVTDADGGTATITLAAYKNYGNGNGFKLGGELTDHAVTLENCLSASNTVRGFDQNNNAGEMILLNCSGFGNAPNYGFNNNRGGRLTVTNSVSLSNRSGSDNFRTQVVVSVANNAWNTSGVVCNVDDFVSTDATQMIMPRKADGSLPDIMFMHLVEGSDLIDKGVNVGLPYGGAAPDLGCFEFDSQILYPPTVTIPANRNQSVNQDSEMIDIVFTWGGSATGLEVSELPDGVDYEINSVAKTLTIKGSPSATGKFDYTVTTLQEEDNPMTPMVVSGTIIVKSANAKQIAFVTTPNSTEDALMLEKLNANLEFNITIIDATTAAVDYSGYDLIILSAKPNSTSAGLPAIEAVDKPRLLLKPFQLQASRWNWASGATTTWNTSQSTMTINDKSHEIFRGLEFTGTNNDELVLFSSVTTNAVTGIASGTWIENPSLNLLGVAKGTTTQSLVEIPIGTTMNGTTVNSRFLMIGLSEYSTANLTPTATQLIENSCYYLMGMEIPTSAIEENRSDKKEYRILQSPATLSVQPSEGIEGLEIYSISGSKIASEATSEISTSALSKGIYLLKVNSMNDGEIYLKFIKR
ncbi:MAG: T9SS type A sorting domain-containing protein [Prevotellaceae bacterium]|jgi:hypothetical protein|nr:T9SS type A sorting domain-containing protein [Prevotellaceae bacterium]